MKLLSLIGSGFNLKNSPIFRQGLLLVSLGLMISLTMACVAWDLFVPEIYSAGQIARHTVKAPRDFSSYNKWILRGQAIVREGDLVTKEQENILKLLHEQLHYSEIVRAAIGYLALVPMVFLIALFFFKSCWPNLQPNTKDLALVGLALCGSFVLVKVFYVISQALSYSFSYLNPSALLLSTPLAAGGVLLQATLGTPYVFLFVLPFSLLAGLFLENSWILLLLIVCGNMIGAVSIRRCSRRSAFIIAGLRVAIINMLLVSVFLFIQPELTLIDNVTRIIAAAFGGLFSGILGGGLAPIAEYLGGYITDIKLLELASLERPLLRELSLQAPGTWNHSMVVGQLGEVAAEAIGAHALLTRVGAFYHDIGKTKKPAYFVENQCGKENRHDKLAPSMSALIIKSHVKDGIEMAEHYRVPRAIIDFIPQHHGTARIEFFYDKALKEAEEGELVDESHYRYTGPKPQSKEAGILMLADAVEASARTLSDPSPAKIQGLVQKIINKVFVSGELDESDLTLKDLHNIAKNFTRVLTGIYHRRIEYSESAEKSREPKSNKPKLALAIPNEQAEVKDNNIGEQTANAGSRRNSEAESSKNNPDQLSKKGNNPNSKDTLKRLGMR